MPLRCLDSIANSSVHSFSLSTEAWSALEFKNRSARHLRMPCCSSQVTLKKSSRGTQFFAHKSVAACTTAPETEAHLCLKQLAAEAARANGWDAETEVRGATPSGDPWTADVLAVKGRIKVAVEIQWSPQTIEETMSRQARYRRSGIRCLWLLGHGGIPIEATLPAARIVEDKEGSFVALVPTGSDEQRLPMWDFLNAVFTKRLRFGVPLGTTATVLVRAGEMSCWSCGADTRIVTGVEIGFGPHRHEFSIPDLGNHRELFEVIRSCLPNDPELGAIKRRYSRTQERSYLSNGCAHCGALVGEFYECEALESQTIVSTFPIRIDEHWRRAIRANDDHRDGWGVYPP